MMKDFKIKIAKQTDGVDAFEVINKVSLSNVQSYLKKNIELCAL